jgi:hypothetical protein
MFRFLADENFNGRIIRGLERAVASLDLVRAQDVGLGSVSDSDLLAWAAENGRVILTHDIRTLVPDAQNRVAAGLVMPGVVAVRDTLPIGEVIADLIVIVETGIVADLDGQVLYLPL